MTSVRPFMANVLDGVRRSTILFSILTMFLWGSQAPAQTRWYVSMRGTDTLSLERFERAGDTITGVWVTYHIGAKRQIWRHEYTIALAADGRARSVHMLFRRPDSAVAITYDARFSDDTVVVTQTPDTLPPHRIAALRGYPLLGMSVSMYELFVAGARAEKQPSDSGTVVVVPITGPFVAQRLSGAVLSSSAFRFEGPGLSTIFTGAHGAVDSLIIAGGRVSTRRVDAFDIDAIARAASRAADEQAR